MKIITTIEYTDMNTCVTFVKRIIKENKTTYTEYIYNVDNKEYCESTIYLLMLSILKNKDYSALHNLLIMIEGGNYKL